MQQFIKGQATNENTPVVHNVAPSAPPTTLTSIHTPAAATKATTTVAAGTGNVRHVCAGISAAIACGATAQTPITLTLYDGASGGTVLWAMVVAAPANSATWIELTGLSIQGSTNSQMTLEFSAGGVAASLESVVLHYYDIVEI